jgi:hypothetical protein
VKAPAKQHDWLPIHEFCRRHPEALPNGCTLHIGQIGLHLLGMIFGEKGGVEVRARPGLHARHELIPPYEWMGFVVDDWHNRLEHEHSRKWYCDAQARFITSQQDAASDQARRRPSQEAVNAWLLAFFEKARNENRQPPKRDLEAFPACSTALGAKFSQMKKAMIAVPPELKRGKGGRDGQSPNRTD